MKRHFLSSWQSTSTQNAIAQRANLSQPYIRFVPAGSKAVLLIELTVPQEDRVTAGYTRKENCYAALVQQSCSALKMDGLLAVLQLKWVAWAMYIRPHYIVLNHLGSQWAIFT